MNDNHNININNHTKNGVILAGKLLLYIETAHRCSCDEGGARVHVIHSLLS